jgi:hypothetical protein
VGLGDPGVERAASSSRPHQRPQGSEPGGGSRGEGPLPLRRAASGVVLRRLGSLQRYHPARLPQTREDGPGRTPTALVVAEGLCLTQTIKHRDKRGQLLEIERAATIGSASPRPATTCIERLNGVFRERLAALRRKTHAFAKRASTWDALLGLSALEQRIGCGNIRH